MLFSLSAANKDFIVEYFSGTGSGGANRNKNMMACRIHHPKSGAIGQCQEERTQKPNRERAFKRLVESDRFQKWLKIETSRKTGALMEIEERVEQALKQVKLEIHDDKGRWIEAREEELRD
jgi:protein subunit release factor A